MSEIKVEIDAASVNEYVAKAVLDSTLGNEIKKQIDAAIASMMSSYDNPVRNVVRRVVEEEVRNALLHDEKNLAIIQAKVREFMTEDVLTDLCGKAWDTLMSKYR